MSANHYIDKEVFLAQILHYQERCKKAKAEGKPRPKIPDTIGKAILDIVKGIASRPNFRGYTYIDEMQADAVVDCVKAVPMFDASRSENPFGFFSRVIWYAFLGRLANEKKQHLTKMNHAFDASTGTYSILDGDTENYGDAKDELLQFYYAGKT
jgi:hypothetical protein